MEPKDSRNDLNQEIGLTAQSKTREQLLLGKGTETGLYTGDEARRLMNESCLGGAWSVRLQLVLTLTTFTAMTMVHGPWPWDRGGGV
jgi:hypothetical protein